MRKNIYRLLWRPGCGITMQILRLISVSIFWDICTVDPLLLRTSGRRARPQPRTLVLTARATNLTGHTATQGADARLQRWPRSPLSHNLDTPREFTSTLPIRTENKEDGRYSQACPHRDIKSLSLRRFADSNLPARGLPPPNACPCRSRTPREGLSRTP